MGIPDRRADCPAGGRRVRDRRLCGRGCFPGGRRSAGSLAFRGLCRLAGATPWPGPTPPVWTRAGPFRAAAGDGVRAAAERRTFRARRDAFDGGLAPTYGHRSRGGVVPRTRYPGGRPVRRGRALASTRWRVRSPTPRPARRRRHVAPRGASARASAGRTRDSGRAPGSCVASGGAWADGWSGGCGMCRRSSCRSSGPGDSTVGGWGDSAGCAGCRARCPGGPGVPNPPGHSPGRAAAGGVDHAATSARRPGPARSAGAPQPPAAPGVPGAAQFRRAGAARRSGRPAPARRSALARGYASRRRAPCRDDARRPRSGRPRQRAPAAGSSWCSAAAGAPAPSAPGAPGVPGARRRRAPRRTMLAGPPGRRPPHPAAAPGCRSPGRAGAPGAPGVPGHASARQPHAPRGRTGTGMAPPAHGAPPAFRRRRPACPCRRLRSPPASPLSRPPTATRRPVSPRSAPVIRPFFATGRPTGPSSR